jgi:hypothetical protein
MKNYFIIGVSLLIFDFQAKAQGTFEFDEIGPLKKQDMFQCLLVGDTYYGEGYQSKYNAQNLPYLDLGEADGYDTSAQNFRKILDDSDLNIVNLETTITNAATSPLVSLAKEYIHYSDIKKTPEALVRHNIHVVSLANNHALDFGVEGLRQAQASLTRHGIKFFGAGENRKEASKPYLFSVKLDDGRYFKAAVISAFQVREGYKRKGFDYYADKVRPGAFGLDVEKIKKKIAKLRKIDKDIFIILYPHWGRDYEKITLEQRHLAAMLEPLGINAIIGQGAHTAQPIVKKDNKITAFNIGNFMFNSRGRFDSKRSFGYSFITKLIKPLDSDQVMFRFYPIYSNNKDIKYVPRFVGPAEFHAVLDYAKISEDPDKVLGRDEYGFFIEYQVSVHLTP